MNVTKYASRCQDLNHHRILQEKLLSCLKDTLQRMLFNETKRRAAKYLGLLALVVWCQDDVRHLSGN